MFSENVFCPCFPTGNAQQSFRNKSFAYIEVNELLRSHRERAKRITDRTAILAKEALTTIQIQHRNCLSGCRGGRDN